MQIICMKVVMNKKVNIGIVGTSWIAEQFINATIYSKRYVVSGICGTSKEKAKNLFQKVKVRGDFFANDILLTDNLEELAKHIDTVYISTYNALHFEHTMQM
jgi:predicted dehydrogenase